MSASLLVAARAIEIDVQATKSPEAKWTKQRQDLENQAGGWVREFEFPAEGFQVAVDEALFFSNNDRVQNDLLRDAGDSLVGRLKGIEADDELARQLWRRVLTREPSDEELQAAKDWLAKNPSDRLGSIRSLAWAVLAGPEARFNR
jgi:hypothetical protein